MRGESRWNFCVNVSRIALSHSAIFLDPALEFDFELEVGEIALEIREV